MKLLQGKTVAITGATGFLGKAFVLGILQQGSNVLIGDKNPEGMDVFKDSLSEYEDMFLFQQLDITDSISINQFIETGHKHFGKVDALVNNAYPRNRNYGADFMDVKYDDFTQNISMNIGGYFLCSQLFSKYFVKHKNGNVVSIGSIYGVVAPKFEIYEGLPMTMPVEYSAIKAAIIHMTKYMSKYFKGKGIRFNCLSPGGIFDGHNDQFLNAYTEHCLSKGMLDPKDLVGTLVFLLSDNSKYVNGQNIIVDDGFTL